MKNNLRPHYLDVFSGPERFLFKGMRYLGKARIFYHLFEKLQHERSEVRIYKNIHSNKRCFIIGGGPSLKKMDLSLLKNEVTFGVNGIFLIYDFLGFEPNYYVVEDFLVFEDRWQDIKKSVINSTCFFPIHFRNPMFDRHNHVYLKAIYEFDSHSGFPQFSKNPAKLIWIGGTVTYVCIQLAFYMGFKEVYLIGIDHNYIKPDHVEATGHVWTSHGNDPNHFHPDYFGKGYRWHDPQLDRMETAYRKAKEVFDSHGRIIKNATLGGKLEVFERISYEELF